MLDLIVTLTLAVSHMNSDMKMQMIESATGAIAADDKEHSLMREALEKPMTHPRTFFIRGDRMDGTCCIWGQTRYSVFNNTYMAYTPPALSLGLTIRYIGTLVHIAALRRDHSFSLR